MTSRRLQGKAPAAAAAAGEGEVQRQQWKEQRRWQKKGATAAEEGGGGRMARIDDGKMERGGGQELTFCTRLLGLGGDSSFLGHNPTIPAQLYTIN
jgi:hypothetical protein